MRPFCDELRMKTKGATDVSGLASQFMIARPRFGRGGDRKRVNARLLRVSHRMLKVWEEVEVTVEIDKVAHHASN